MPFASFVSRSWAESNPSHCFSKLDVWDSTDLKDSDRVERSARRVKVLDRISSICSLDCCNSSRQFLVQVNQWNQPWSRRPTRVNILVLVVALLNQIIFDTIEPFRELKLALPIWDSPFTKTVRLFLFRLEALLKFVGCRLPRRTRRRSLTAAALLLGARHSPVSCQGYDGDSSFKTCRFQSVGNPSWST